MSKRLLVYQQGTLPTKHLVEGLVRLSNVNFAQIPSFEELQLLLRQSSYDIVLIFAERELANELIRFVKATKNLSFQRDTHLLVYFFKPEAAAFKQALMAGASQIYLHPLGPRELALDVQALLQQVPLASATGKLRRINPLSVDLQVYGRIGAVAKGPAGESTWTLEGNLRLKPGVEVKISHRLFADQKQRLRSAQIMQVRDHDIFYKYHYSYSAVTDGFDMSVLLDDASKVEFTRPKIKIAWITEHALGRLEELFDKHVYSLYVAHPDISEEQLQRIDPLIVVAEGELACRQLALWLKSHPRPERLCFAAAASPQPAWRVLPAERVAAAQLIHSAREAELEGYLARTYKDTLVIRKHSPYSRFFFSLSAEITAVAASGFALRCVHAIEPGALVRLLAGPAALHKGFALYARVQRCDGLEGGFQLLHCAMVPQAQTMNMLVPDLLYEESLEEAPEAVLSLLYLRRFLDYRNALVVALLIAAVTFLALRYGVFDTVPSPENYTPWENAARSIKDAFK